MTDDDARERWTQSARDDFRASRDALLLAILQESDAILAASSMSEDVLERSTDVVHGAAVRYSESHYELTGEYGIVSVWDAEIDEFDDDQNDDLPLEVISIVMRSDYRIESVEAVLAAGRSSWLKDYPHASDDELASHVGHIGGSLYAVAHHDGWEKLERVDGIRALGGIVKVVSPTDYEPGWLDGVDWNVPASGLDVLGEILYSQSDRWGLDP